MTNAIISPPCLTSIKSRRELAAFLEIPLRTLNYYSLVLGDYSKYRDFEISKRTGGKRRISAPIPPLKAIQRRLATHLLDLYQPRSNAHAYLTDRSIITNATLHVSKRWILTIDLQNFFPSINFGRVRGVLMAPPLHLNDEVATAIAQLCVRNNQLPQGAPTSPILSNMICHGLDRKLLSLAKENRCHVTRYADDICISTNTRNLPAELARSVTEGAVQRTVVGSSLAHLVTSSGFTVNEAKVHLAKPSQRQLVTGIVVNKRLNVKREYIRELRAALYKWKTKGLAVASSEFFSLYDEKNRVGPPNEDTFRAVVKGRLMHIRRVRGNGDPLFKKYALMLGDLDPSFIWEDPSISESKIQVHLFVEGSTDYLHLESALKALQKSGRYSELHIVSDTEKNCDGEDKLLKDLHVATRFHHPRPQIFMFDRDNPKIIAEVSGPDGGLKAWGNGVFSFAIPVPKHRESERHICIEYYYDDALIRTPDKEGRRLYYRHEFDPDGYHKDGEDVFARNPKKTTLIYDDEVMGTGAKRGNVALSKKAFAKAIAAGAPPYESANFEAFSAIFDLMMHAHRLVEQPSASSS